MTHDSTKEACCAACAGNPTCAASLFSAGGPAGQQCYNIGETNPSGTCKQSDNQMGAFYSKDIPADCGYVISNGNCGEFTYGGMHY